MDGTRKGLNHDQAAEASGNNSTIPGVKFARDGNEENDAVSDCSNVADDLILARLNAMKRSWTDNQDSKKLLHLARSLASALDAQMKRQ